jgi:hypothetical protein
VQQLGTDGHGLVPAARPLQDASLPPNSRLPATSHNAAAAQPVQLGEWGALGNELSWVV